MPDTLPTAVSSSFVHSLPPPLNTQTPKIQTMADTCKKDPMEYIAAYFGPAAEYGMWLERDVLRIPAKIRYFSADNPKLLGMEIMMLLICSFLVFIAMPMGDAIGGYPVSLRQTIREGRRYMSTLWVYMAMVSGLEVGRTEVWALLIWWADALCCSNVGSCGETTRMLARRRLFRCGQLGIQT